VSAQLVNAGDGFHAWSGVFDRKLADVFSIQDEIAGAIVSALRVNLAVGEPPGPPTQDVDAYDLWVKGRSISYLFTPQAIGQARACFEAAIARDPAFARPYFGLADLLFNGVQFGLTASPDLLPTIRSAITRSLQLDDTFADAHALMGVIRGVLDYDWDGAAASFRRALELGPGSSTVMIQHAWYHLVPRMQIAQAVKEALGAVVLDPLSPRVHGQLGLVCMTARDYARAAEECRVAVDLAPGLWWTHWVYGTALLLQGRFVQGLRESRRLYDEIHHPMVVGAMALVSGLMLRRTLARKFLDELETMSRTMEVPPTAFALAYIGLGDDRMFDWLNKAIDARDPVMTHLPSMPLYDGIRDDPRFGALLVRMNLA
jgi:serine/threonine-protein kinase